MRNKNAWRVYWTEEGKKKRKHFEGHAWAAEHGKEGPMPLYEDSLAAAVVFAKELKARGLKPELVSCRRAFIQKRDQLKPPSSGMMWCPYCVKWRRFNITRARFSVRDGPDDPPRWYLSPAALRCPVCAISDANYWVRKYNGKLETLSQEEMRRMYDAERRVKRGG